MADTIKTQILDNLVTTLEGITATNGYNRTVRAASRSSKSLTDAQHDIVFIISARDLKSDLESTNDLRSSTLTVMLGCIVEDGSNVPKAVDDIAADVEKALAVDISRGSKAKNTTVVSIEDYTTEELEPTGSCMIEVEILYRHRYGDPYTLA